MGKVSTAQARQGEARFIVRNIAHETTRGTNMTVEQMIKEASSVELAGWTEEKIESIRKALLMEKGVIDPAVFSIPALPDLPQLDTVETTAVIIEREEGYGQKIDNIVLVPGHPQAEKARRLLFDAVATGAVAVAENVWINGLGSGTKHSYTPAGKISCSAVRVSHREDLDRWVEKTTSIRSRRQEIERLQEEARKAQREADKAVEFLFDRLKDARAEAERADRALRVWNEYLSLSNNDQRTAFRFLVANLGDNMVREAEAWHPSIAFARARFEEPAEG
jgi:hypothetical protein